MNFVEKESSFLKIFQSEASTSVDVKTVNVPRGRLEFRKWADDRWQNYEAGFLNGEMAVQEAIESMGPMRSEDIKRLARSFNGRLKTVETRQFATELKSRDSCWSGLYENMLRSGVSPMKAARQIYNARLNVVLSLQQNTSRESSIGQELEVTAKTVSQAEKGIAYEMRDEYKGMVQEHGSKGIKLTELESAKIKPDKAEIYLKDAKDVLDGVYSQTGTWVEAGKPVEKMTRAVGLLAFFGGIMSAAPIIMEASRSSDYSLMTRSIGLVVVSLLPGLLIETVREYKKRIGWGRE